MILPLELQGLLGCWFESRSGSWGSALEPPAASMQLQPRVAWALAGAALCSFLLLLLHARLLKEGNRDDQ